jgi:hypothetical protein
MMMKSAIKDLFKDIAGKQLSDHQRNFVTSVWKHWKKNKNLSDRQLAVLTEMRKYLP